MVYNSSSDTSSAPLFVDDDVFNDKDRTEIKLAFPSSCSFSDRMVFELLLEATVAVKNPESDR